MKYKCGNVDETRWPIQYDRVYLKWNWVRTYFWKLGEFKNKEEENIEHDWCERATRAYFWKACRIDDGLRIEMLKSYYFSVRECRISNLTRFPKSLNFFPFLLTNDKNAAKRETHFFLFSSIFFLFLCLKHSHICIKLEKKNY